MGPRRDVLVIDGMGPRRDDKGRETMCLTNRGLVEQFEGARIEGNEALCHVRRGSFVLDIVGIRPHRDARGLAKSELGLTNRVDITYMINFECMRLNWLYLKE